VTASTPSKVFRIDRKSLEAFKEHHSEMHAVVIWTMGRDVADKLCGLDTIADDKEQMLFWIGVSKLCFFSMGSLN